MHSKTLPHVLSQSNWKTILKVRKGRYCSVYFICKKRNTERLIELPEVTLLVREPARNRTEVSRISVWCIFNRPGFTQQFCWTKKFFTPLQLREHWYFSQSYPINNHDVSSSFSSREITEARGHLVHPPSIVPQHSPVQDHINLFSSPMNIFPLLILRLNIYIKKCMMHRLT